MNILLPLYPYKRLCFITNSKDEFRLKGIEEGVPEGDAVIDDGVTGRCMFNDAWKSCSFIVYASSIPTLVHELSHAIFFLFDAIELPTGDGSREAFCYLLEYCISNALKQITFDE